MMGSVKKVWKQQWKNALTKPSIQTTHWNKVVAVLKTKPKIFLDIGVGEFGSEAWEVEKTYPDCKIVGFEPQPERFKSLQNHNFPGLLLPYVISEMDGIVEGYMGYEEGKSDFWLFDGDGEPEGAYQKIHIDSYTLDKLEEEHGPFNAAFIWADTEGSELSILKGANRLFDENKIIGVNVEVRQKPIGIGACVERELIEFFRNKGFKPVTEVNRSGHYDVIFIPKNNMRSII